MLAMGPRDLNSAPYSPVHCSSHSMTSFQSSELTEPPVVENSQLFAQRTVRPPRHDSILRPAAGSCEDAADDPRHGITAWSCPCTQRTRGESTGEETKTTKPHHCEAMHLRGCCGHPPAPPTGDDTLSYVPRPSGETLRRSGCVLVRPGPLPIGGQTGRSQGHPAPPGATRPPPTARPAPPSGASIHGTGPQTAPRRRVPSAWGPARAARCVRCVDLCPTSVPSVERTHVHAPTKPFSPCRWVGAIETPAWSVVTAWLCFTPPLSCTCDL